MNKRIIRTAAGIVLTVIGLLGMKSAIISVQPREPDSEQPVIDDITIVSLVQKIVVDQILQGGANSRMRPESVPRHEVVYHIPDPHGENFVTKLSP